MYALAGTVSRSRQQSMQESSSSQTASASASVFAVPAESSLFTDDADSPTTASAQSLVLGMFNGAGMCPHFRQATAGDGGQSTYDYVERWSCEDDDDADAAAIARTADDTSVVGGAICNSVTILLLLLLLLQLRLITLLVYNTHLFINPIL